uniref:NADH-ubiquinone oxidoreductase chain 2 n=1 Tax=Geisha distinctissima TaxID=130583 RepID=C3TX52_9HEMI|nr:NADH dehydrogenase subunit 2 [Geisha distinctissima]ACI28651.1 NADH dehydrogenase subunit 2 [Geisha distinctissima]
MKLNSTKTMMISMITMSSIMTMSSNNLLYSWMSMEINMIVFLPLMAKSNKMKDQIMKYFIIQSTASSMLLMSTLISYSIETPINSSIMLMTSLMMKLGLMPTHTWLPTLMNSLTWENCVLISTIQKITPMIIMMQTTTMKMSMIPMIMSLIIAPISALKQLATKKIMSFSSISNMPWMLISMNNSKTQFMIFMIVYSTMTMMMMNKFKKLNIQFINQLSTSSKSQKMSMMIMAMSISGMPPMMGFLPKWIIIQTTISNSITMSISLISSSILSTFIYIKMISPSMMIQTNTKKMKKKESMENKDIMINLLGLPAMMLTKSI